MAEERRRFTPAQKQEVVEYAAAHGIGGAEGAAKKYHIVESVIRRWKKQAQTGEPDTHSPRKGKRKWTAARIAKVLKFNETHTISRTCAYFRISTAQLHQWKTGKSYGPYKKKTNGAANNLDLNLDRKDALMWLERWRQAYFDRLKAETPLAADVLAALRGGK